MRKISIIIAILLCLSIILLACAEKAGEVKDTTAGTELGETVPELPAVPVKNFGGREFTIFTSNWWDVASMMAFDITPEEYNGEPLNDAAYERKTRIEEMYNCKISQIQGVYDTAPDTATLQKSVNSGDPLCDFAMMRGLYFTGLLTDNYIINLDELKNVDFDNPWWRKECSDALLIGGKRYGVSGSISTMEIALTAMMAFNKNIVVDYVLDSPYDLVKSGSWTYDKVIEMCKAVAHDLNGDGIMDDNDLWGISYGRDQIWNLINSCGVKMMEIDSDGYPQYVIDLPEHLPKAINILEKLFNKDYSYNSWHTTSNWSRQGTLFTVPWANGVIGNRSLEFDFGIIPLPKYDTAQNDYMSNIYGLGLLITCIPITNNDLDDTGLFMEALSYEGYKNVFPVYYENLLKTKGARDSESEDMIDYIFGNLYYDTGTLIDFNGFAQYICYHTTEGYDTNLASMIASQKPAAEAFIKKVMDIIG
ncbi:MAG: hypothetical protein FWF15_09645 [Oscillospiraceae bacterium]|nr:hypothetical protein [Oscillospiraceae bacterium]